MCSTSDKRRAVFSLLQQLWWGETRGPHAVSRCPFPLDYLRANNATTSAKRYGFYSCIMSWHERVGGVASEWLLHKDGPVISGNQGWVLEKNLSHLLSAQLLLLFGEGQGHSTLLMGGLQLLCVLHFFCLIPLLEKLQGHLRTTAILQYLCHALMPVISLAMNESGFFTSER